MGGKWKDMGDADDIIGKVVGKVVGVEHRYVENKDTGETKKVWKTRDQSTGEAIENGQFEEE